MSHLIKMLVLQSDMALLIKWTVHLLLTKPKPQEYNYWRGCVSADVAELADAPDLGSGGRPWGFESLHPH